MVLGGGYGAARVGEGGEGWKWRRHLLAWGEESVRDCCYLLLNIVLHADVVDKWRWLLDPINRYSVSGVYHFLMTTDDPIDRGLIDDV